MALENGTSNHVGEQKIALITGITGQVSVFDRIFDKIRITIFKCEVSVLLIYSAIPMVIVT